MQLTVQAWHPTHFLRSMTMPHLRSGFPRARSRSLCMRRRRSSSLASGAGGAACGVVWARPGATMEAKTALAILPRNRRLSSGFMGACFSIPTSFPHPG